MSKIIFSRLFLPLIFTFAFYLSAYGSQPKELIVFHSPGCHKCEAAKKDVLPLIGKEFGSKIAIVYLDIQESENYRLLLGLRNRYAKDLEINVPLFFINGKFLESQGDIKNDLRELIISSLDSPGIKNGLPSADILQHFRSFKPFIIIGAGLLDGINPCAFTVIVFFISFLALQGYRKRELLVIGFSFISAVFFTYLLVGLGFFAFLYRLNAFWAVSRALNFTVGIFSVILGLLAFYDFFSFKLSGKTEGLLLQLPASIKKRVHMVISDEYRIKGSQNRAKQSRGLFALAISAVITGFLVSLLEAVCTGQTYLPALVFILKAYHDLKALIYLIIYNLMFILPLLVIFMLALWGVSSVQFSGFLKKHLGLIKILMGILFLALGIFLIWRV